MTGQEPKYRGKLTHASPFAKKEPRRDDAYPVKREAVLKTAAALFREHGFDATSISDLAAALNVTKPTIYYYVKNKDALLLGIKLSAQNEILDFMRETEAGPGNGYEKLRALMIRYGLLMTSDVGACFGLIGNHKMDEESRTQVEERVREGDEVIFRIFRLGQLDGSLVIPDHTIALFTLFSALNSLPTWFRSEGRIPAEKLVALVVDLLLDGVRTDQGRGAARDESVAQALAADEPRTAAARKKQRG